MREHKSIEIFSLGQTRKMASIDAPSMSTRDDYADQNSLSYYVCANTWAMLWEHFSPLTVPRFAEFLADHGLVFTIKTMQDEATRIINDEQLGFWATLLFQDISQGNPVIDAHLCKDLIGTDDTTTVLFLLRYPKRFSPCGNDRIQDETLKDFIATENRTKLLQRRESYSYVEICKRVRDVISRMYDWDYIISEIDRIEEDWFEFSSGAALDSRATLGDKVVTICKDGNIDGYIRPIFGVRTLPIFPNYRVSGMRISKVVAVPKSYKASRIIAMENVRPLALGKKVESIFRVCDRKTGVLNLEDQTINQRFAEIGSITGKIATLDASHASDLISKSLFVDVFPTEYVARVLPLLPTHVSINGDIHPLQMASTSGHTLTFRHETIVYKAICQAAVEYFMDLCPGVIDTPVYWAYGDDSVISSEAYDVAVHFFSRLGLKINDDKSYATGDYRESCGKDYICGIDVSSVYFPRFPVIGSITTKGITFSGKTFRDEYRGKLDNALTMLIDLQKRLFPYSYKCARFLASVVQTAYPSITTSVRGTVCSDLWDFVDTGKPVTPQAYAREHVGKYAYPKVYKCKRICAARDTLSGDNVYTFDRAVALDTVHTVPTVAYRSGNRQYTSYECDVYEYWKYQSFLKNGPRYLDPLMELLGISSPAMTISEFFGESSLVISKR